MSEQSCLDKTALEKLSKLGGPEFLVKMIDTFLENTPKRIEAARAGEKAGDLEAVERAVHSLRSSAANLGAAKLQDLAARIERLAEEKRGDGRAGRHRQALRSNDPFSDRKRDMGETSKLNLI